MSVLRSLLYVPGHRERMVERALGTIDPGATGADAVILDLEDAVPASEKAAARALVSGALRATRTSPPIRLVRINSIGTAAYQDDLGEIVCPGLDGIVIPKAESADDILSTIDRIDREPGITPGTVRILPLIETALGVEHAFAIASATPRIIGLQFGAEDYALDLGLDDARTPGSRDFVYARSAIVNAATAARRPAFDGVWTDIEDLDGLAVEARRARSLGFTGKSLIHPSHIAAIHAAFSPTASELEDARRIVSAYEAAEREGLGAVTLDGRMIDRPVVERARRTLERDPEARQGG